MRKKIITVLCIMLITMSFSGCGSNNAKIDNDERISVIATLYPQYDFAKQILGERGDVTMLLPPGVESHTYEPKTSDIISINKCDLFIYTAKDMEPWAYNLINGIESDTVKVLEVSDGIKLDEAEHHEHEEEHANDPHIWTSPVNAMHMIDNILSAIIEADSVNESYYRENAENYKKQISSLDEEFRDIVKTSKRKEIVFAGRFALHYFVKEYGLSYIAAYDSCSAETEPSAAAVKNIIDEMREKSIPIIYCEELVDQKIARSIADETKAEVRVFHSCHNVSKDDLAAGITYVDIMKQNAENLRKGLN